MAFVVLLHRYLYTAFCCGFVDCPATARNYISEIYRLANKFSMKLALAYHERVLFFPL